MNRKRTRLFLFVMIVILFLSMAITGVESQFTHTTYLPLVQFDQQYRVNPKNRAESLAFFHANYLIKNPHPINWNGTHASCDPGSTSPAYQDAVLQRINYFRAMAGVPAQVTFSDELNLKAQAAALLMSVNGASSHNPPETWVCYSEQAHEGASNSNLYLGIYGWDSITSYIKDPGEGNYAVGHRRWILYPQTKMMGTGDVPPISGYDGSNALWVFDEHRRDPRPATRDGFVSWPPPGYVPYPVVFARWSFSYPDADFNGATVRMTQGGNPVSIVQMPVVSGAGENTIVWQITAMNSLENWPPPTQDTRYTVQITNVIIDGQCQDFNYDVIVFDPDK